MKKPKIKKNSIYFLILILICIFAVFENYRILKKDTKPLSYDTLNIYFISIDNFNQIKQGNIKGMLSSLNSQDSFYPPFITIQPLFFYPFLGISEDIAVFSNIIHIIIIIFSTYYLGRKIAGEDEGILSVLFLISLPVFWGLSRVFLPDFGLAAIVILNLSLFFNSDFFDNIILSFFFGVTLGFGLLIKWSFLLYVLPIIIFVTIYKINSEGFNKFITKKKIINILIIFFIIFLLVFSWYRKNFFSSIEIFSNVKLYNNQVHFQGLSNLDIWIKMLRSYIYILFNILIGKYLFILTIFSCLFFYFRECFFEKNEKIITPIILGILLGFFPFLNFIPSTRYFLPFVPILLIITSMFIFYLLNKIKKFFNYSKLKLFFIYLLFTFFIFLMMFSHLSDVINKEYLDDDQDIYGKGIIIPKESRLKSEFLFEELFSIFENTNSSEIILFPVNELTYIVSTYLREENIFVDDPLFCLTRPDLNEYFLKCGTPYNFFQLNSSLENNYLIVDSNFYYATSEKKNLMNSFPDRYMIAEEFIKSWEDYKNFAELVITLDNIYSIEDENLTIYIYKLKRT